MGPLILVGGLHLNTDRTEEEVGFQIGYERATYGVCRQDLDAMGERAVKNELASGKYGHAGLAPFEFVSACLADMEFVRLSEAAANRDEREEATLSVAREANDIARSASFAATAAAASASEANTIARSNRLIAIAAAIIAAVAAIAAIVAAIAAVKGL